MATKNNIRSIRFSDELAEKEKQLAALDEKIRKKQNMLAEADMPKC